ncbi:hypothetical protein [Ktedonobacter robiniae]|uniref:Uncharacterized protein n=1 Tax=Ktedonobacter robiniae TaxID=2778365 RepID=A0ABQ3URU6_9CHLR|nr:hypothetical protein [Ktedonobacter robiniae]GHO55491.1 hypothetical protein KSB_39660 [Ktedonobacter robiniae]
MATDALVTPLGVGGFARAATRFSERTPLDDKAEKVFILLTEDLDSMPQVDALLKRAAFEVLE